MLRKLLNVAFGAARLAFGVYVLSAPEKVGATWVGAKHAKRKESLVLLRALGARDVALGAGTMIGAAGGSARPWLAVSAAADLGDLGVTLLGRDHLPEDGVRGTVVLTASAALTAGVLIALDRPKPDRVDGP